MQSTQDNQGKKITEESLLELAPCASLPILINEDVEDWFWHDWIYVSGEADVGINDHWECTKCDKTGDDEPPSDEPDGYFPF